MDLFKLGVIDVQKTCVILKDIAETVPIFSHEQSDVVVDALRYLTSLAPDKTTVGDLLNVYQQLQNKIFLILTLKLELPLTFIPDWWSSLLLHEGEKDFLEKHPVAASTIQKHSLGRLWAILEMLSNIINSQFDGDKNNSEVMNSEFFRLLSAMVDGDNTAADRSKVLKNTGLIFSSYIAHIANSDQRDDALKSHALAIFNLCFKKLDQCQDQQNLNTYLNLFIDPYLKQVNSDDQIQLVQLLWPKIESSFVLAENGVELRQVAEFPFYVLTFLVSFIHENCPAFCPTFHFEKLFPIIQAGLIHQDLMTRKQCQYVLKLLISLISKDSKLSSCVIPYDSARQSDFDKVWSEYFLCIETLEENQTHVIAPIFKKIDYLWKTCQKSEVFHESWMYSLYKRMFDHDSRIVKQWSIEHLFTLPLTSSYHYQGLWQFVSTHLLAVLGDYHLFLKPVLCLSKPQAHTTPLGGKLSKFFSDIVSILPEEDAGKFINVFLGNIFDGRNWEDVSYYHVTRAFSSLPCIPYLDVKTVKTLIGAAQTIWAAQEPVLRTATRTSLIKIVLNHLHHETSLGQLVDVVTAFGGIEFLSQKEEMVWDLLVEKSSCRKSIISECKSYEDSTDTPEAVAINIVLCLETSLTLPGNSRPNLTDLFPTSYLVESHCRPYISYPKVYQMLQTVSSILDVVLKVSNIPRLLKDNSGQSPMELCRELVADVYPNLLNVLADPKNSTTKQLCLLNTIFAHLFEYPATETQDVAFLQRTASDYCSAVRSRIESRAELLPTKDRPGCRLTVHALHFLTQQAYPFLSNSDRDVVLNMVCEYLLQPLHIWLDPKAAGCDKLAHAFEDKHSQRLKRLEHEELAAAVWGCLKRLIEECPSSRNPCLEAVLEHLPCAGRGTIGPLVTASQALASHALEGGDHLNLVTALRSAFNEHRSACSAHLTLSLLTALLTTLLQPDALCSDQLRPNTIEVFVELFPIAAVVRGAAPLMARHLTLALHAANNTNSDAVTMMARAALLPLLVFGALPGKKHRALREAVQTMYEDRGRPEEEVTAGQKGRQCDQHLSPLSVLNESGNTRCYATLFLLTLDQARPGDVSTASSLMRGLEELYYAISAGRRTRDFGNSLPHRTKTRALQAVLVLLPLLTEADCHHLLEWVCVAVSEEQQQPSVRYLIEWIIAAIVLRWPALSTDLFKLCEKSVSARPGCIASFLASLALCCSHSTDEALLERCLELAVPWCMGQHFNTRLYAQVAVSKIWARCEVLSLSSLLEKFGPLRRCLRFVAQQSRACKNSESMLEDFIFSCFHPFNNHTIQSIYHHVPRLSLLADDEWLSAEWLQTTAAEMKMAVCSAIPFSSAEDDLLAATSPAPWVTKSASVGASESTVAPGAGTEVDDVSPSNMQRKVVPWTSLSKQLKMEALASVQREESLQPRTPLVVVTSLLQKATNLGGLCRTCEVLGAGLLVLPSLGVIEDQAFTGLSVAAHKWMPIKEVASDNVREYLRNQRECGYTVVAAEQTAHSVCLTSYTFPARTVLLLGNEREGIPCALLQEVDVCVEIPQSGVTRSLNAHVAGALCVWEYARQHGAEDQSLAGQYVKEICS